MPPPAIVTRPTAATSVDETPSASTPSLTAPEKSRLTSHASGASSMNGTQTSAATGSRPPAQTAQLRGPDPKRGEQHKGGQHEIRALRQPGRGRHQRQSGRRAGPKAAAHPSLAEAQVAARRVCSATLGRSQNRALRPSRRRRTRRRLVRTEQQLGSGKELHYPGDPRTTPESEVWAPNGQPAREITSQDRGQQGDRDAVRGSVEPDPRKRLKGFEPSTFCMASSSSATEIAPKCLQISRYHGVSPRMGLPRIAPKCRGFRQGTDNEKRARDPVARGLITRRSRVRIPPPLLESPPLARRAFGFVGFRSWFQFERSVSRMRPDMVRPLRRVCLGVRAKPRSSPSARVA